MRTVLVCASLVFLASCASVPETPACSDAPCSLVVLHTNDTHGHPLAFDHEGKKNVGGMPARASLIADIRKSGSPVLLLDAGDFNTGRPESSLFDALPDVQGMNLLGYDAVAVGNHEFYKGEKVLAKQLGAAQFPILSANTDFRAFPSLAKVEPYVIKSYGAYRVAVLGLTTLEALSTASFFGPGLRQESPTEAARRLVPELRKKADIVVALTHLGEAEGEGGSSVELAREVSGIDLVVDGHTHTRLENPLLVTNRQTGVQVPIVQTGQWGLALGEVKLSLFKGKVSLTSSRLIAVAGNEDAGVVAALNPYLVKVEKVLSEKVYSFPEKLEKAPVRLRESTMGNLLADATLWAARDKKPDCAIHNSGAVRADFPAGDVTLKNVYEVLPFDNTIVVLTASGRDLHAIFEKLAQGSYGSGAFPVVAGMTVIMDRTNKKLVKLEIGGRAVEENRIYRIATNSYLAAGGDTFGAFKKSSEKLDSGRLMRDVVADYLRSRPAAPKLDGRMTVIGN